MFGRPINVTPTSSAPGAETYQNRGIWNEVDLDFMAEDGSVVTDHKKFIDVRDAEYVVVPRQGDVISIPADGTVPAEGTFTVLSAHQDGGGMTCLVLSESITSANPGQPLPTNGAPPAWLRPMPRERGKF
jgi:hypothetical protein